MTNEDKLYSLEKEMIERERGCPKRIQHFLKVYEFAVAIAKRAMLKNVFRTETGKQIYSTMFNL